MRKSWVRKREKEFQVRRSIEAPVAAPTPVKECTYLWSQGKRPCMVEDAELEATHLKSRGDKQTAQRERKGKKQNKTKSWGNTSIYVADREKRTSKEFSRRAGKILPALQN